MEREYGSRNAAIWLLGDSSPDNYKEFLQYPFDDRHVAIHAIWDPIMAKVQDIIYRENRKRVDSSKFFIRNAVQNSDDWKDEGKLAEEMEIFAEMLGKQSTTCKLLFTFGDRAYRFAKSCESPPYTFKNITEDKSLKKHSKTFKLGTEFASRLARFDASTVNILPLLHVSISRGRFLRSHEEFCKGLGIVATDAGYNYFVETSAFIAKLFLDHFTDMDIWI